MKQFPERAGQVSGDQFLRAMDENDAKTAQRYLAKGGDPNYEDENGRRAVHIIAEHVCSERLNILRQSLQNSALLKVNWLGYDGDPPSKNYKLPSQIASAEAVKIQAQGGGDKHPLGYYLEMLQENYAYTKGLPYKGKSAEKRWEMSQPDPLTIF